MWFGIVQNTNVDAKKRHFDFGYSFPIPISSGGTHQSASASIVSFR